MAKTPQILFAVLLAACSSRTAYDDSEVGSDPPEPSELELLCEEWCDAQRTCGFVGDYEPEGECLPNCVQGRGWDEAWDLGCSAETRAVLTCLGDSTCEELAPMFDLTLGGPPPCASELGAVLSCSSS